MDGISAALGILRCEEKCRSTDTDRRGDLGQAPQETSHFFFRRGNVLHLIWDAANPQTS